MNFVVMSNFKTVSLIELIFDENSPPPNKKGLLKKKKRKKKNWDGVMIDREFPS